MDEQTGERLFRLIAAHQNDLFRYVFALLPNEQDSRDVLQETYVALSRKLQQYDPSQSFLPLACRFAYLEVLKFRERKQQLADAFDPTLLEMLAVDYERHSEVLHARLQALDECVKCLPQADREMIQARYQRETSADQLAERLGQSRRTLFRNLERVRRWLHDCISKRLAAEGLS